MSSGARHGLGALFGVIVTPVIAACMMYGTGKLGLSVRALVYGGDERWVGAAALLFAAVLLGLAAGSRLSPLASLIPGLVYTGTGLLWILAPRWSFQNLGRDVIPRELFPGYTLLAPYGILLLLGVGLVVASAAPSRWKAPGSGAAVPRFGAPPPAGPPPMHGAPAPMGAPQPSPWPAPGQPGQPGPQYGGPAPQYGPPAQPAPGNPPPLPPGPPVPAAPPQAGTPAQAEPSAQEGTPAGDGPEKSGRDGSDDDKPGDWTQMYGGNR
ncbi:MAG: hypothetical protein FWJ90_15370 [Actinomadura sp.]